VVRRLFALSLALLAACPHPTARPAAPAHPRLVVLIVIDQLPSWAFERQRHLFHGGLARLLRDGASVGAAEIPWASTFTAVGHASIGTGAPPSVTGIVGNSWYRRLDGRERPAEYDPDAAILHVGPAIAGEAAPTGDDGASSRGVRTDGLADVLVRATANQAHAVAVALKARAACLMTGRRPELAIWYEPGAGGMTTSAAYAHEPPRWLAQLAHDHPVTSYFADWSPLDAALLARETHVRDDAPGEGSEHGLGAAFPHDVSASDAPAKAFVQTPFADQLVLDTAFAAIDGMQLGADDVPDLLAVSLGAHDFAGHAWGPGSWEVLDLTLRLDAALATFFDKLDAKLGRDGYAVVLTSDHGATPLVERSPITGARRIPPAEIEQAAEHVLDDVLGPGPWVAKLSSQDLYLTTKWSLLDEDKRTDALTAAAYAISQIPQIAAAGRTDQISGACASRVGLDAAECWSIVPGESGELYVLPAAGSVVSDYKTGTHHDAPFDDNRRVPILVMAPGLAPQQSTGSLLQVAPTVAALLGIPAPPEAQLPPLFGLVAR
jgi:predicted AlkP superfamily pyrophosphatase or phosphodiesterase